MNQQEHRMVHHDIAENAMASAVRRWIGDAVQFGGTSKDANCRNIEEGGYDTARSLARWLAGWLAGWLAAVLNGHL